MPEGSHQPESCNTGKTVPGPTQAGSPDEPQSNAQPGNEPPIAECYPESFSSADLLDTPISVTGLNSARESTQSRGGDPEGTFQQRTVNSVLFLFKESPYRSVTACKPEKRFSSMIMNCLRKLAVAAWG